MIDEKKIKQAAIECADEYYFLDFGKDREETNREIFVRGAHWAINEFLEDLWHDASEEPKVSKWIVTRFLNDDNDLAYEVDLNVNIRDWKTYVQQYRIVKWLYIDDILSKKGGKK